MAYSVVVDGEFFGMVLVFWGVSNHWNGIRIGLKWNGME